MKQLRLGEAGHSAGRRKNWALKPGGTQCLYHDTKCQRLQTCGLRVKSGSQRYFVWPTQYVQKHLNSLPVFKNWDLHMKKQNPFFSYFSLEKRKSPGGQHGARIPAWHRLAGAGPSVPAVPSSTVPTTSCGLPSTQAERRCSRLVTLVLCVPRASPARPWRAQSLLAPLPIRRPPSF